MKAKRKSVLLRIVAFLFIGFLLVNLGYYQVRLVNLKSQSAANERTIEEKTRQIEELTRLLETSDEAKFIEDAARERLGYVFSNERVFYETW